MLILKRGGDVKKTILIDHFDDDQNDDGSHLTKTTID